MRFLYIQNYQGRGNCHISSQRRGRWHLSDFHNSSYHNNRFQKLCYYTLKTKNSSHNARHIQFYVCFAFCFVFFVSKITLVVKSVHNTLPSHPLACNRVISKLQDCQWIKLTRQIQRIIVKLRVQHFEAKPESVIISWESRYQIKQEQSTKEIYSWAIFSKIR